MLQFSVTQIDWFPKTKQLVLVNFNEVLGTLAKPALRQSRSQ